MNSFKRGALIVIEGVDRSGKSTQCKKLVESLNTRHVPANLISFPDRTTNIGGIIDKYLKQKLQLCDEAIHLMFSANRWEKKEEMEKLLKEGVTLIVDRYSYSGIIYSSVKKNMDLQWCKEPEKGLLKPDLVLLLSLNENEISQRPNYGDERYENKEFQEKVAAAFHKMQSEEDNWEVIEAGDTIERVHEALLTRVLKKIDEIKNKPLKTLMFSNNLQNGK